MKVKKDSLGLYVNAGGWVARRTGITQFNPGDEVKTHHFGGSTIAGVGKDSTCKKGQYLEYWVTSGVFYSDYENVSIDDQRKDWNEHYSMFVDAYRSADNKRAPRILSHKIIMKKLKEIDRRRADNEHN